MPAFTTSVSIRLTQEQYARIAVIARDQKTTVTALVTKWALRHSERAPTKEEQS